MAPFAKLIGEGNKIDRLRILKKVEHVLKKWKEKSFAAAVDRSQIAQCEEKLGIPLNDFIGLILAAMKTIAPDLGL